MATAVNTEGSDTLSTESIRLMADLIIQACKCQRCGVVPTENELLAHFNADDAPLTCAKCRDSGAEPSAEIGKRSD